MDTLPPFLSKKGWNLLINSESSTFCLIFPQSTEHLTKESFPPIIFTGMLKKAAIKSIRTNHSLKTITEMVYVPNEVSKTAFTY